jgi:hypothetical protein
MLAEVTTCSPQATRALSLRGSERDRLLRVQEVAGLTVAVGHPRALRVGAELAKNRPLTGSTREPPSALRHSSAVRCPARSSMPARRGAVATRSPSAASTLFGPSRARPAPGEAHC